MTSAWWTNGRVRQAAGTTVRKLLHESGKWSEGLATGTRRSRTWETLLQSAGQDSVPKWQSVALLPRVGGPCCQPGRNRGKGHT